MTKITLHFKDHKEADKFFGWFVDGGGDQDAGFGAKFPEGYDWKKLKKIENLDLYLTDEENLNEEE